MIKRINSYLLSEKARVNLERYILYSSILGFLLHLFLIFFVQLGIVNLKAHNELFTNPIAAIYTPFSFILFYEVYLLVFYLQKSFSQYIGKQYEIVILIIIRRAFKDIANLELSEDFFHRPNDLIFLFDIGSFLILSALLYLFYKLISRKTSKNKEIHPENNTDIVRFIKLKILLTSILIPVLCILTIYSIVVWGIGLNNFSSQTHSSLLNINNIFFDRFFTVLILTDVLLLLMSFTHSDKFSIVMRNTGFVISTILIKLSFTASGIMNNLLVILALLISVSILFIHNKFNTLEKVES